MSVFPEKKEYIKKIGARANQRITTREQALADEIYNFFSKKLSFGTIMGIIRNKGYLAVYEIFQETKRSKWEYDKKLPLFLSLIKKQKIEWEDG
jgi:hypothetical protein